MKMGGLCVLPVCLNLPGLLFKYTHKIKAVIQPERGRFYLVDLVLKERVLALVFFCLVDMATHLNLRKKMAVVQRFLLPARVVQALNLNFDDMDIKGLTQPRLNSNAAFPSDYDALMIRRNALVAQQKRSLRQESVLNHEIRLPQEWTY
ncbi:hypothetical protein OIU78_006473 [Salix suchowensis]|nr:hypothetical protein OIU78_006473 [Salix suchowensis]